jgi:hypothetical protein
MNVASRILFRYVLSAALQLPHRRPFLLSADAAVQEFGKCLPLFPLDFFPSTSTSPSPIHLLHGLTIFPAWPRAFSCVSRESHLYTVVDFVLLTKGGIAKEEVNKIRPPRTSHLANSCFIFTTRSESAFFCTQAVVACRMSMRRGGGIEEC